MHYHPSPSRILARAMSFLRSPRAWALILSLFLLLPHVAQAASCPDRTVPDANTVPSTSPMASGGSIVIDASACDPIGIGINPLDTATPNGHVTADAVHAKLTYTNNGNGATTDSFDFPDADNVTHHVTVNIGPATSPIAVFPASIVTPRVGIAYSQALSASGGAAPYTFTVTGTLPGGLTLSGNIISGTPNQAGSYSFSITATDSASVTGTKSYPVIVPNPSLTIPSLPNATVNSPYSRTLSTSDGTGPITYTLESGTLPAGLSLIGGVISGTPTVVGTTNFTIRATDSSPGPGGPYFTLNNLSIQVTNTPPTAGPVSATVAYGSSANPVTLNITGATATSVAVGTQAAHGTAIATGTSITYTPTSGYAGPDSFTYTATNGAGTSSPATVTITVSPPTITYTPTSPPSRAAGVAYNESVATGVSGGKSPNTYAPTTSLPPGLAMASNGTITGTPTAVGTFVIPVRATDSSTGTGPFTSAPANVTLTISAPSLTIAPTTLPAGTFNAPYSQTITTSGGTAAYSYTETGALPNGITLSSGGVLSGTPTQAGSFPITVQANDSTTGPGAPYHTTQAYTLTIAGPTITLSPASLPNATVGTAYSQTLSASGGAGSYTFNVSAGAPPTNMTLAANGTLSGTPSVAGDFNFTVQATDSDSFTGSRAYSMHVAAIAPGAPTNASATAGQEQATVSFDAPTNTGGAPITGYTVTSSPGNKTGTGTASPVVVAGLLDGTMYTFTVVASNSAGPGPDSDPSTPVTPKGTQTITFATPPSQNFGTTPTLTASSSSGLQVAFTSATPLVCTVAGGTLTFLSSGICIINADQTGNGTYLAAATVTQQFQVNAVVPGAPTIGPATAGNRQASVSFTPPGNVGGATITGYTVTSIPDSLTATGTTSPITITNLTNGTLYRFTVTANNSAGPSGTSGESNPVTPQEPQTISFTNPISVNFATSPQLNASATSGLQVSFTSTTPNICTVTGQGVLTTKAPGQCSINADQSGDAAWLAASTVTQSFTIAVPGGAVSFSSGATLPSATGEVPYSYTITATGGAAPYVFTMTGGSLPTGLTFSNGVIQGTPLAGGTPFNITVRVTDQATQTADQAFQLTVNGPSMTITPATVPGGTVGHAYSQVLSTSGGVGPYSYAVTSGALPGGLSLSSTGTLTGTPTATGNFNFSVASTDSHNFQVVQAYSAAIGQPAPIVVNSTATVNANGSQSIPVTNGDTGPITSLAITQQPAHGTATVNGLTIVYTPAHDYFGSDSLKYTATGPGGTSSVATVTITVVPGSVPTAAAQSATVLAGKAVTIQAAKGATNGPFTAVTLVNTPSSGTAVMQGTDIVYTADPNASGTFGFDFTLSNAFGASQPAHATITVNARPVAPNLTATTVAGTTVLVDLTATAHGGPFSDAKVVSVSPANAGTATVQAASGGYKLSFTAAPAFGGMAQVSYTLTNAYATSDPGTVSINVTLRSDPSKNAEVLGVLDAQADSARRMALGQINNFQRRLEALHSGSLGGFSNGVTFSSASSLSANGMPRSGMPGSSVSGNGMFGSSMPGDRRISGPYAGDDEGNGLFVAPAGPRSDAAPNQGAGNSASNGSPGGLSVWTGGAVNFGKMLPGSSDDGIDFTTSGLSMGADKQVTEKLALGAGLGYGHDVSDIGQHTSRSTVDSYNVALYGSYRPAEAFYADALVGYQWLSFDARRYVTDNGNTVHGSRDGKQWFASFSTGYQHSAQGMMLTPYGRLDIARANLEGYTETGDAIYSLKYQGQDVNTSTATVGVLAQWSAKRDYGTWAPQLRAEFGHDLQGSSQASMRYADLLNGPTYQATLQSQSRNHTMLGAGVALQTLHGWMLRFEYQNYLDNTSRDNQSILLGVEKKFGP
ncbi:putative Ig domain-containing protein [Pinirhizobacter sp.]|uniref:putative Ig domain-containing protein n=1 Tax=Pinirhizobacter sp. TaxID=2950432 RepID=UPI002F3F01CC